MRDSIEFHSRVGPDGTLDLHVALGEAEAGADLVVTIRRASPSISVPTKPDPQKWHRFVEQIYGSCDGLGIEGQPQGEFEQRKPIE